MLQTDSGALPRDCMITDISLGGARLLPVAWRCQTGFIC